jgi:hypothetical protein
LNKNFSAKKSSMPRLFSRKPDTAEDRTIVSSPQGRLSPRPGSFGKAPEVHDSGIELTDKRSGVYSKGRPYALEKDFEGDILLVDSNQMSLRNWLIKQLSVFLPPSSNIFSEDSAEQAFSRYFDDQNPNHFRNKLRPYSIVISDLDFDNKMVRDPDRNLHIDTDSITGVELAYRSARQRTREKIGFIIHGGKIQNLVHNNTLDDLIKRGTIDAYLYKPAHTSRIADTIKRVSQKIQGIQ